MPSSASGLAVPVGTTTSQEDLYIDSAPKLWFGGVHRYGPDEDSFYWGLSGSVANPVYAVGCFTDFTFKDNVTMNDIVCDALGTVGVIQTRNYLELTYTLESLFPLSVLTKILRTGAVTLDATEDAEKMGIGDVTGRSTYYKVFFSRVYDPESGAYFSLTGHRAQFVDAWEISTPIGDKWSLGVTMRLFADSSLPAAQKFATVVRYDASAL